MLHLASELRDGYHYLATAVRIPFLRRSDGIWNIVWPNHLDTAKWWRKQIRDELSIPRSKELHAVKLASSRGNFLQGKYNFKPKQAAEVYRAILRKMDFLPDESVMSVTAN